MHRFHDEEKRPWDVRLTIADIKRVKAALALDLMEPATDLEGKPIPPEKLRQVPNLAMVLQTDLLKFYDVLWVLLQPEAKKADIDEESFGRALAGESLINAHLAFLDEWQDFFDQLRRPAFGKLIAGNRRVVEKVYALAATKIEAFDLEAELAKAERQMEELMLETGPPSTDSPGS